MNVKAVTILELMIMIAAFAMICAIALPTFQLAEDRSRVSRARFDMRSLAVGLQAYQINTGAYPPCSANGITIGHFLDSPQVKILEYITTPIAYTQSASLRDPVPI